jgi:hypothetical protein
MNMSKILLVIAIVFSGIVYGQERSDSAVYVVPTTTNADINLYIPPKSFEKSTAFNGYHHLQTQATVVLTMIDGANYLNIKTGMDDQYFADNKLLKVSEQAIATTSGLGGIIYTATFMLNNRQMTRHIVFIGDLNNTLWLSTTFPTEFLPLIEKELINSYSSVTLPQR